MDPYSKSSPPFLRISVILILLFHLSSQLVNARVLIDRRIFNEEIENDLLKKPGLDAPAETSPMVNELSLNNALENDIDHDLQRTARAAVYHKKENFHKETIIDTDAKGIKHVQRIPASSGHVVKHGTPPPPEESSDDETFESLEANREAFIEILNDNARHPHRKRSSKRHNDKMVLKFDDKAQRWTLTEQQSDEWF